MELYTPKYTFPPMFFKDKSKCQFYCDGVNDAMAREPKRWAWTEEVITFDDEEWIKEKMTKIVGPGQTKMTRQQAEARLKLFLSFGDGEC